MRKGMAHAPGAFGRGWIVLWTVIIGALAAIVLLRLGHSQAQTQAQAAPLETVRFAADLDYPPFSTRTRNGEASGFDIALFRTVAGHAGFAPDIRLDTWGRVVADLKAGRVDVAPMLVTEQRQRQFLFSEPYLRFYHLAFGPAGGRYVASLHDLAGARVAVQRAGMAWDELRHTPGVRIVEVDNEPDALRAVADGRADYAIVPHYIGYEAQRRYGLRQIVRLSPAFFDTGYAYAINPKRPDLVERINVALRETTRSGEAGELYIDWLANLTPTEEAFRSGLMRAAWAVVPLLILAIVLLVWWRRAQDKSSHLERHDPVTHLVNRSGFRQELAQMIAARKRFAVVRLDLLDLGAVESMAGNAFVDELLVQLAKRLQRISPHVAKVHDRGFMVAVEMANEPPPLQGEGRGGVNPAQTSMQHLLDLVRARVEIQTLPIELIASAGAALHPDHGDTPDALMRAAHLASEDAAARPGTGVVYHHGLAPDTRRLTLLTDLRAAIRNGTLGHALQPKLDLRTNKICGAEMLVRWHHPTHGELQPADFVPLAERTGVIGEMTVYLVDQAVAHLRDWKRQGLDLTLSVNVSVNDLGDPAIVDRIIHAARDVRGKLVLEITETAVMRDPETAFAAVERLRAGGLRISLDDFGTGNASLTYLRRLAPEEVKIDRSFITGLLASEADQRIVRSTIQLAHAVDAVVTAEGVEDAETLAWLRKAGCESAQGHGIGRPVEPEVLVAVAMGSQTQVARLSPSPSGRGPG